MRKMVVALAMALLATASVEAGYRVVGLTDVVRLAREGVADRTIIAFLEKRQIDFVVGTEEILWLRDAGAGEELVRYLIERTAPGDSYASPYADRSRYDYDQSAYDDPGDVGSYVEYGPSYGPPSYVGVSIGPYFSYDRYYRGGLGGWLSRTFGFGHRYGRHYRNRYDYGRSYRYDRGRNYRYDYRRSYRYDRGRSDGRSFANGYRSRPGRSYRISSGRSTSHRDRGRRYPRQHAVPRGGRHEGGRSRR